jgi:hypothetical protein
MNILDKVMGILFKTNGTLPQLKEESNTLQQPMFYLAILTLIPFMATFIGYSAIGFDTSAGSNFRLPVTSSLIHIVVQFLLTVGGVFLTALIVNYMAPKFGGKGNYPNAFKAVSYACTPSLIGGVLAIHPKMSLLGSWSGFVIGLIIAIYGLYILYQALPVLMESSKTSASTYTLIVAVGGIIIWGGLAGINNLIATNIFNKAISGLM